MDVWTLFGILGAIGAVFAIALALSLPKNSDQSQKNS